MPQRDILLRWLEQLALVIRRLLYGPGPVDIELARAHIDDALQLHLGPMTSLITALDPPSAAALLHDPDRIFGYAQLLGLQAAVLSAGGDPEAATTRDRAISLARHAIDQLAEAAPAEWRAWLTEAETH